MSRDLRHQLGQEGERIAAEHLVRLGFQILERNYRTRWGELDIVAHNGTTLAFCEVKTRRLLRNGESAFDALGAGKRWQVRQMATRWLIDRPNHPHADMLRFDAIGVSFDGSGKLVALEHLEGAF